MKRYFTKQKIIRVFPTPIQLFIVLDGEVLREGDSGHLVENPVTVLAPDGFQVGSGWFAEHGSQAVENLLQLGQLVAAEVLQGRFEAGDALHLESENQATGGQLGLTGVDVEAVLHETGLQDVSGQG